MVKCSRCGVEIDDSFETCPNCGNELSSMIENPQRITCGKCGLEVEDDSEFCPNCGIRLNEIQVIACLECGSEVNEGDLVCGTCGAKINWQDSFGMDNHSTLAKNEVVPIIEESLENVASETLSFLDRIILFFKKIWDGIS